MTIIQDDFDFLDTTSKWYKFLTAGDIAVINGMSFSSGANNFLVYKEPGSLSITSSTIATPIEVTFGAVHGVAIGSKFYVSISSCDAVIAEFPFLLNGVFEVTASDTSKGTIQRTGVGAATTGVAYRHVSDASQRSELLVACSSEGAGLFGILWNRYDPSAQDGLTIGSTGYGVKLSWEASGVRKISILKVDTTTGLLVELGSKVVSLFQDQGTDLGVLQRIKLITHNESALDSDLPQDVVIVRAYINEDDDGKPELEVKDSGRHTGGTTLPPARAPGTFAISFGTVVNETLVDAVSMEYGYVLPKTGVYGRGYSTRSELRRRLSRLVSVGGSTNYDDTFLNEAIQDAILETINTLGDKAWDLHKSVTMSLTASDDQLVTLNEDVGRVMHIWDAATHQPVLFYRRQTAEDVDATTSLQSRPKKSSLSNTWRSSSTSQQIPISARSLRSGMV